jgi:Gas vesicle synthesis protein GvpO
MAAAEERNDSPDRMSAADLALAAKQLVAELTGFAPESVSGIQWDAEKWLVMVDVCELERVPSTTDVMATYVVQLDERGELLGYKRTRRYIRSQAEED